MRATILYSLKVIFYTKEFHSAILLYTLTIFVLQIVEKLLENGADVNIADIRGATPLHRATSRGNLTIVKLLLDHSDLRVNVRDAYGNTPLHLACEEDRQDEAKLLVKNGADLDIKNKDKLTPLDLCTPSLAKLLEGLIKQE